MQEGLNKEDAGMNEQAGDPWVVLGINPTTDREAIRTAYLTQVRKNHPDQFRGDPTRYQAQEERMKDINRAYQMALTQNLSDRIQPTSASRTPPPNPSNAPRCPIHHVIGLRTCEKCDLPLCRTCLGFMESLCLRHMVQKRVRHARRRAIGQWLPLILGVSGLKSLEVPSSTIFWSIIAYLAIIGLMYLRRRRWLGCLAFLFLPYSFVLAGLYSLFDSLSQWRDAGVSPPTAPQ